MGNNNKQKQYEAKASAAEADRAQAATELRDGSPEYKAYSQRINDRRTAINSGDIDNAPDFIGNNASQALINRKREATWNATPTGMQAIGNRYADPNQLAMQTQMLKDQQSRDSAAQLEGDWKDYISDTQAAEGGLVSRKDNINTSLMSDASQRTANYDQIARQIAQQRANMWAGIVGAGIGGVGSMFAGKL